LYFSSTRSKVARRWYVTRCWHFDFVLHFISILWKQLCCNCSCNCNLAELPADNTFIFHIELTMCQMLFNL